jgi:hypothetical protein
MTGMVLRESVACMFNSPGMSAPPSDCSTGSL